MTNIRILARRNLRPLIISLVAVMLWIMTPILSSALVGLGGMVSEKLAMNNVTGSSIELTSSSTVSTPIMVAGAAPAVTTNTPSVMPTSAVLFGSVVSMDGLPSATRYFQWGYDPSTMVNETPHIATTATGIYSAALSGFTISKKVYYRFVCEADGTSYGSTVMFLASGGTGGNILRDIFPIILALVVLAGCLFKMGINPFGLLCASFLGIMAYYMVSIILSLLS